MNYKRVRSQLTFRLWHGSRAGVILFGWFFAACGTVFTLLQAGRYTFKLRYIVMALAASLIISIFYGIRKARIDHLPDAVIVCDDRDKAYELKYETKAMCSHFNQESAKYFGRSDYVDDVTVESWRSKNPHAFIFLQNSQSEPCAALCVFGLVPSFMDQFIKGRVAESDIEADDILDLARSRKAKNLYLSAIIVKDPNSQIGHRRASVMVWAVIQYLKKVFGTRRVRTVYAVPVNKASENLLKGLGFRLTSYASARKDRHNLYSFEMSAKNIASTLQRVGDFSRCCSLDLSEPASQEDDQPKKKASHHA